MKTPPQETEAKQENILIVDDSESSRLLLSTILKKAGYEAHEAADGRTGLELAHSLAPDLILLDIIMPGMDGYEVCRALKAHPKTAEIPIIFLSGRADPADKIKGLQLGAVDYITKPYDKGETLARVRTQTHLARVIRELGTANEHLRERQAELDQDLKAAAGIQESLLPKVSPQMRNVSFAWQFTPSQAIGGDILNIIELSEGHLGVYVFDVAGHGVPAALVTVSVAQVLDHHPGLLTRPAANASGTIEVVQPWEVMAELEKEYPFERFEKYFTVAYAVLDAASGRLAYAAAGHPPPIIIGPDGALRFLNAGGPVIGLGLGIAFEEGRDQMKAGDKLVLYTDGVTDYRNATGEIWGEERFHGLLASLVQEPAKGLVDKILAEMMIFGHGARPGDDISILALEFTGPA